jgi:hypothetical protein
MKEYIMFLDESGDHNLIKIDYQYPVFTLVGCIFEKVYYDSVVVPKIDNLKKKYFDSEDIILHSYEIRKYKNSFRILYNIDLRQKFIKDMNDLLSSLDFTIIASCIRKDNLINQYNNPKSPYDLAFYFIMERYVKFLDNKNGVGMISIESRDTKSNAELLEVYNKFRDGVRWVSSEQFQRRILGIEFLEKHRNINGHQIADLTAYPISRYCLDKNSNTNHGWEIVRSKLRRRGTKIEGYGYKEFP